MSSHGGCAKILGIALLLTAFADSRSEAQFLVVDGNFGAYQSPTQFLNTRSYTMGGAQMSGMANAFNESQRSFGNPNAYYNQLRDPAFVPRFDVSSRQSMVARRAATPAPSAGRATPSPDNNSREAEMLRAVLDLSTFFNRYGVFVWPKDLVITDGEVASKRKAAEDAITQA